MKAFVSIGKIGVFIAAGWLLDMLLELVEMNPAWLLTIFLLQAIDIISHIGREARTGGYYTSRYLVLDAVKLTFHLCFLLAVVVVSRIAPVLEPAPLVAFYVIVAAQLGFIAHHLGFPYGRVLSKMVAQLGIQQDRDAEEKAKKQQAG